MRRLRYLSAAAAVAAVFAAAPEAAAAPMTHDGFYLSMEAGLGYLNSSVESALGDESLSGMTFSSGLLMGGTVGPVVIGGGFLYDNAFSPAYKVNGNEPPGDLDLSLYLISFGAFVDVYPDPTDGLHFLGFVGWGGLEFSRGGDVSGSDPTGILFTLGGGYDFWVGDEWSVGPLARFTYAPLSLNGVDFNTTQFTVAADFKFH